VSVALEDTVVSIMEQPLENVLNLKMCRHHLEKIFHLPPGDNIPPPPGDNTPPDCTTKICNPLLPEYGTLCQVLTAVIRWITQIGALIAVVLIIWTGFLFVTAQGNPAKISKAKSAFLTTIIGTAILLGASAIAQIIVKTVFTITSQDNPGVCSI
jgi:hypothetical protein